MSEVALLAGTVAEARRAGAAEPVRALTLTVDPERVLGPLRAAAAAAGGARDVYFAACAEAQFWADGLLAARRAGDRIAIRAAHAARAEADAGADRAAAALIAGRDLPDPDSIPPERVRTPLTIAWPVDAGPAPLDKLVAPPLPECCGYNLADIEVVIADAAWLARRCRSRMVVAGIRGGGSVLAPLWAAALRACGVEARWTSARPLDEPSVRDGYDPGELAELRALLAAARAELLVVDDLPDTGETVTGFANALAADAERVWLAAVGRVQLLAPRDGRTTARVAPALLRREVPLWALLLEKDHPALLDRLADRLGATLPDRARLVFRCPTLEARYGRKAPWLPWNHPALVDQPRRLINPRKTPLTIVDAAGAPAWHLRFIGEGPWGLAEHARLSAREGDGAARFIDGFRVMPHRPGLVALAERLAGADAAERRALLERAADVLAAIIDGARVASGAAGPARPVAALRTRLALLARRFDLPDLPALADGMPEPAPDADLRVLHTSLRYAHGAWHWQVDASGTIHRFQQETSWGGVSHPALEVASFAMEQGLGAAETALVSARCGLEGAAVAGSAAAAMLLAADAVWRGVRQTDPAGLARLRDDLAARRAWVSQMSGPRADG